MVNKSAIKLRAQLAKEGSVIVCPGVQDGLSARVCLDEGFENLYMVSPQFRLMSQLLTDVLIL